MESNHTGAIHRINYLSNELDALYHRSSLKFGISDSVSVVLYTVQDRGGECPLGEIYKATGISRQTVNSAVRSLERDGMLYLEQDSGRTKRVHLTGRGRDFADRTVARLFRAETAAFDSWGEDEIADYIRLMEKYLQCFRREVERL